MKYLSFITLMAAIVLFSCKKDAKYVYNQGKVYGTSYHIVYESPEGKDYQQEITEKFKRYNHIFSTYDKESEISKVNRNENVELAEEFITCFNKSMDVSEKTDGAFDVTVGPLVFAWGFGPDKRQQMTKEKVDSLLKFVGYHKVKLENGKIIKQDPNIKIDLASTTDGYTSDLIASFLKEKGCKNYMVEIGGEVVAKGKNEKGNYWRIGIQKPVDMSLPDSENVQGIVSLENTALSTSGNYMNFYVVDGKKYAHIIDPATGYPVQHSLLSATVIADECIVADAYSTAFMVLGMEKSIEIVRKTPGLEVYFIYADSMGANKVYVTEKFKNYIVN